MSSENDLNTERLEDLSVFLFELFAADLMYTQKHSQKAHLERLPVIGPLWNSGFLKTWRLLQ